MNCALSAALLVAVLGTSPVFTAQAHTQAPWDAPGVQQTHGAVRLRGERTNWRTMRVRQRLAEPLEAEEPAEDEAGRASSDANTEREWLIHLKGPIHRSMRVELAGALGVKEDELQYVPLHTFLVSSTHGRVQAAKAAVPHVLWVGHLLPHHKVSPDLHEVVLDDFPRPPQTSARRRMLTSDTDALELAVMLAPHSHHRSSATVRAWADRLGLQVEAERAGKGEVEQQWVRTASPKKIIIRLHREAAPEALRFLSQQHETSWIEPRERFRLRNKWSKGIIQSGQAFHTPLFDKGLTGAGQVIGIADTGIDMNLCFFKDNSRSIPVNRVDPLHRKVISYRHRGTWGNTIDEEGHGSHTTGSLVAKSLTGADAQFNGMAPDAKLIFDDIYAHGDLTPPDDLEHDLFPVPYQHGARVRSESWGGDSIFYTTSARETDAFSRKKRGFLVVWAAGNDGDLGMFTIGSPATAKNILCIGAQQSTRESMMLQEMGSTFVGFTSTIAGVEPLQAHARWASFGAKRDFSGSLVVGSPLDACTAITGNFVRGKIALVQRGTCLFTVKAQHLQAAGAAGMICYDNTYSPTVLMGGEAAGVAIPCLSISRYDGETLRDMLVAAGGSVEVSSRDDGPDLWQQNLADFSGKGPTGDGRLMPDIVAPGADIWSAKASGRCGVAEPTSSGSVASMGGTSMAAPVAAGGVALIRQYFEEAWHPGGKKGQGESHEASGSLLRAMVMNGARRLTGALDVSGDGGNQWIDLDPVLPNNQQGFGSMDLETVLHFDPPTARSPPALFVRDDMGPFHTACLNTGNSAAFGFLVSSGKRFKVTIAWTDPEASLVADVVLINDLDLTVLGPGNKQWVGNNITSIDKHGDLYLTRDRTNNKEQVELKYPVAGDYTVIVRGHHVPQGPQCYSLVVTGDFEEKAGVQAACSQSCATHGECIGGECVCRGLWSGVDCLRPIPLVTTGTIRDTVYPDSWQYYAIDIGSIAGGSFHIKMLKQSVDGDPDLFIKKDDSPTLIDFSRNCECDDGGTPPCECREVSCDSCDDSAPVIRQLKSTGMIGGLFIIGVSGFCCDPVEYTLNIRLRVMGCDGVLNSGKVAGCDGSCPATKSLDVCGECGGDGTSCLGCDGIANSGKHADECGVCGGDDSSCVGCDGVLNSGKVLDVCDDCDGDGTRCLGCDGLPFSNAREDVCDVCKGDGTSCLGCDGIPKSGKVVDACGVCGGDGSSCKGCDGVAGSGLVHDACGVCGGDGMSCAGCDGVPHSGAVVDGCGVCDGFNASCTGCDGSLYGPSDDWCGVCGGDNSTCLVCMTEASVVDDCGVCGGDNSSCAWLSAWSARVRVVTAIQFSGISEAELTVDSVQVVLRKTISGYFACSEDRVRIGAIVEKSSDSRRQQRLAVPRQRTSAASYSEARYAQLTAPPKAALRARDAAQTEREYVVVSFKIDVDRAMDARRGAKRSAAAIMRGEFADAVSQQLRIPIQASVAKPAVFTQLGIEGDVSDIVSADDGRRGSPLILVLLVYLLLALAAAVWAWRVPEKARRPPCVVFALWIFFGILGVHRFYTGTRKMGLLYASTLGVLGIGWLSDLYWQRRYLFGISPAGGGTGSRRGVLKAGKELIENSTFGETWRRNTYRRENGRLRLDEEAEAGQAEGAEGGEAAGGSIRRNERLGAGSGRRMHGESCSEDDEDVQLQIYGAARGGDPQKIEVAEEVSAASGSQWRAKESGDAGDDFDALATYMPAGTPSTVATVATDMLVTGVVYSGASQQGHNSHVHTHELDELAIHEPANK